MAHEQLHTILNYLHQVAGPAAGERTDRQLLEAFAFRRDEAAFATLLHRRAALVWGVCVRILGHAQDAEDAFQATFLVLARKAGQVRWREDVGNWLHAVAVRTALKARAESVRRQRWERQVSEWPAAEAVRESGAEEIRPVLDEELSRLPEKYRAPFILHFLEGKTYAQAARALGWPEGTVATRLTRARELLRMRLGRRGLVPAVALAAGLSSRAAPAAPVALLQSTIEAAVVTGAGEVGAGLVSARIAHLTRGVLKAMFLSKLKTAAGVVLVLCLLGAGAGLASRNGRAADAAAAAKAAAPDEPRRPGPPGEGQLRKEVERLNEQLAAMKEKLAALEKKFGASEEGPVLYKGKPASFWIRALKDRSASYRKEASEALAGIAEVEPKIIPVIVSSLKDRDSRVWMAAAQALGELGPQARTAVPALIRRLKEGKSVEERWLTVRALSYIGPAAVPAVAELLQVPNPDIRFFAIGALSGGGPTAVPLLVKALKDENREVRVRAVKALGEMGTSPRAAVVALLEVLRQDRSLRIPVIGALGSLSAEAGSVIPALARFLADENPDVRSEAARALTRFGPRARAAVPALVQAFKSKDRHVNGEEDARKAVAAALRRIDVVAAARAGVPFVNIAYIPELSKALHDKDPKTRQAAARALGGLDQAGSFATGKPAGRAAPTAVSTRFPGGTYECDFPT
jgi:RNA polymerase sigma factor (sigma-70 family)